MENSKPVSQSLKDISAKISTGDFKEAIRDYDKLTGLLKKGGESSKDDFFNVCTQYALFLNDRGNTQGAIEQLVRATQNGMEHSKFIKAVRSLISAESQEQSRKNYQQKTRELTNKYGSKIPAFDELKIIFIPVNDAYAILDLEKGFLNLGIKPRLFVTNNDFSDTLISTTDNFPGLKGSIIDHLQSQHKCYLLIQDPQRFFAYLQYPEEDSCLDQCHLFFSEEDMKDYFQESGEYLPWKIMAENQEKVKSLHAQLNEIHQLRLLPENRRGNNVLLTIGIPSLNRGHRALEGVRTCLNAMFDEEIEILVSNNCSETNLEGYEEISQITDARLHYHKNPVNKQLWGNIMTIMNMARGKFFILVSDEDKLAISNLGKLLAKLKGRENSLAFLRPSLNDGGYQTFGDVIYSRGNEAVTKGIFRNNYLSAIVYNTAMMKASGIEKYIGDNLSNVAVSYYPHLVIDIFLTQHGDFEFTTLICALKGEMANTEPAEYFSNYQTPENRTNQHQGFLEVIFDFVDRYNITPGIATQILLQLMLKTIHLLKLNTGSEREYFDELIKFYPVLLENQTALEKKLDFKLPVEYGDNIRMTILNTLLDLVKKTGKFQ